MTALAFRLRAALGLLALAGVGPLAAGGALAQLQVLEPSVPGSGMAGPCATPEFTIAAMPWASGAILARVHAGLIEAEFDCRVRVQEGDLATTVSAMTQNRQPAAAVEVWASRIPEVWNAAIDAGSVRSAGPAFGEGPLEAWFVPAFVRADTPALTSAAALAEHWAVFAEEEAETAPFYSCPQEWACAVLNANILTAHGLEERFEIVNPVDRGDLDQALAGAVAESRPVVGYYWQPNALVAQLDLVPLDMGAVDEDALFCAAETACVPFAPSAFPPDMVVNALADWVFSDAPVVAGYFARAQMPLEEMNALLAWQIANDADAQATADHFIATRAAVWSDWVEEAPAPQ